MPKPRILIIYMQKGKEFYSMMKCFFTNLQKIVINNIYTAQMSLKIAVAWINFEIYKSIFLELLGRGVKIYLIIDDNKSNRSYQSIIDELLKAGALIKMVKYNGIMHHKFCVIDDSLCFFGSFNWTMAANVKNIEDLNICDDVYVVNAYRQEFNSLWDLSEDDIKLLNNPLNCMRCGSFLFNVMIMEQDGYNQTKTTVMQLCNGGCVQKVLFVDFFDINFIKNYYSIIEYYSDEIEKLQSINESSYEIEKYISELESKRDFEIENYFSNLRKNRMGVPIIHAVGKKSWQWFNKNEGSSGYKIIWKERGIDQYIDDFILCK